MTLFTFITSFKILTPNSGAEHTRDEDPNTQIPRNTICPVTKAPHRPTAISNHSLSSVWLLPLSGTASHEQRGTSVPSGNFLTGTFFGGGRFCLGFLFCFVFHFETRSYIAKASLNSLCS